MSEQKKPKIDLKARLGKKSVGSPGAGPAIPPPVGIPKPPLMGAIPGGAAGPKMDASNPYGAIEARHAPKAAEPKAIKIEMSQEVVDAQKKGRTRVLALAGIAAGIAGIIGFAFGSGYQRGQGAKVALEGAQSLAKEVDAATTTASTLSDVLGDAGDKLAKGEFPDDDVNKLAGIDIPFGGANLTDKGIGRFSREVVTMLIDFANKAKEANDQKERIRLIMSNAKDSIHEVMEVKTNPKFHWSVYVRQGPHGPMASMQPLPETFLVNSDKKIKDKDGKEKDYDWPEEFKIQDGKDTVTLKRFKSGDPTTGETPPLIPVAPDTEAAVCPQTTVIRVRGELADMTKMLKGDQTPGQEETGLLDLGKTLVEALKKIGQPS